MHCRATDHDAYRWPPSVRLSAQRESFTAPDISAPSVYRIALRHVNIIYYPASIPQGITFTNESPRGNGEL